MNKKADYIIKQVQELESDAFPEVADAVAKRSAKVNHRPKDELLHIVDLEPVLKDVRENRGKFKGSHTGYTTLDAKMGGLERGSVVLIAGETSHGKSALATNIAGKVAQTVPTLYISLEMTLEQMMDRLDWIAGDKLPSLELVFQKNFAIGYRDLEPLIQKAKQKFQAGVVFIDYLQYLGRGMTHDEVAKMSKEVKSLALRYDVCMVVITSVRKGGAEAKFRRKWTDISTEDLMGTSAIAYDADTILLVSRKNEKNEYEDDAIFVKVLKTRNVALNYKDPILRLEWDRMRITEKYKKSLTNKVKSDNVVATTQGTTQ